MPFSWFVALRYLRDAKGQTLLILSAVSVGVSVVVFLSALIGGLQASLITKTLGSQAHVTLRRPREAPRPLVEPTATVAIARLNQPASQRVRSIDQWPTLISDLDGMAGVVAASPMVSGSGTAMRSDASEPILIRGVDPERFRGIIDLSKRMVEGRFDIAGGRVAIGSGLADVTGAHVGDKLRIVTTEGIEDVVTVSGVFTLGNNVVDGGWLITSLRHAQSLYALPGGATAIELKTADVFDAERIASELAQKTGLDADSWMTLNAELLTGLSAQNSSKSLIQFFVVLAVALGIASVLIVSVVQKSREIGILRAVGTSPRRIHEVFLIQGGLLGMGGSLVGGALGVSLAKGFEGLVQSPDGSPRFPVALSANLLIWASVMATGIGVLAAVIPARRAARIDPAIAIRNG